MADVHRLGDVRAAEVDDDRVLFFRRGQAQARGVGVERAEGFRKERRMQTEINKPRARDFRRCAEVLLNAGIGVEEFHDLGGQSARIGPARLGEGHGNVGLVVAEARVRRRADRRVETGRGRVGQRGERAAHDDLELGGDGRHTDGEPTLTQRGRDATFCL